MKYSLGNQRQAYLVLAEGSLDIQYKLKANESSSNPIGIKLNARDAVELVGPIDVEFSNAAEGSPDQKLAHFLFVEMAQS